MLDVFHFISCITLDCLDFLKWAILAIKTRCQYAARGLIDIQFPFYQTPAWQKFARRKRTIKSRQNWGAFHIWNLLCFPKWSSEIYINISFLCLSKFEKIGLDAARTVVSLSQRFLKFHTSYFIFLQLLSHISYFIYFIQLLESACPSVRPSVGPEKIPHQRYMHKGQESWI